MTVSAAEARDEMLGAGPDEPEAIALAPAVPLGADSMLEDAAGPSWRESFASAAAPTARFIAAWTLRLGALALGVLIWHFAVATKFNFYINFENVPAPETVWSALLRHLSRSQFYTHIAVSLRRILIGYALATGVGILTGLAMGRSRLARDLIMPYVEIIRPIPAVAWIPLAILMWPTEESSIIYITFLGALFPIILNTSHGVEQTPEVLVRAARSLGARRTQIFRHVVLPAGEIISGQYGIGYFTWNAYSLINYPDIVVGMLTIGLLGTGSTYAVRLLTRPFLKWQRRTR